ncbi:MAG: sigma-70 family RNA polymerase sigma factor [Lachnospiraceae bacterium]|nr:sigma-70 family RNA polymerase sigma factor [Lachnospiraceae bacterium]
MDSSLHVDEEIAEIYNRHYNTVYRICFSFMKNAEDAEDMVQETFLKLISSKKQFESEEHEKAWLIVTASNTCKDELRRWKRRLENIKSLYRQENVVRKEDDRVLEWVMALPVKYKQVIYLYYYEGYRTSEIAGMLHCSESTVRNQLLRGRSILKKNSVYRAKSGAVLAAVLAGSLLAASTVYAVYVYGLRDLHLGKETVLDLSKREELPGEVSENDIPRKEVDIISLGGIEGSPEYSACSEWKAFLDGYDTDGAILSEIGNGFAGLGEYELVYNCYTQDMADKVDEICEKYELSKLQGLTIAENYAALCRQANIGDFCSGADGSARWDFEGGSLYDDGSFDMDGRVIWKGPADSKLLCVTDYQFGRAMKGSFNPFTLNVGEMEEYHEWEYLSESGQTVLLANSSLKALIIAERDHSFIVVNVLGDWPSDSFEMSDEMLEELADLFDFSAIP